MAALIRIEETGMRDDMTFKCTYRCPHAGCGRAAVGYNEHRDAEFVGQCAKEHYSTFDARSN